MTIKIEFGLSAISSYRRLAYTAWHAIAEFIDNSTQNYINNKAVLDKAYTAAKEQLDISITYDRHNDLMRIVDNALGMELNELQQALKVAHPPAIKTGRSKYGLGMKTAACWIGNHWTIRTTKLGSDKEYIVTVDVDKIEKGDENLHLVEKSVDKNKHYTVIEITKHNKQFHTRTLGKIKRHLESMYRKDFHDLNLILRWQSAILKWTSFEGQLLKNTHGTPYKKEFDFVIDGNKITGWAGILEKGSRSNAGFSILQNKRVIKGWPDSWRPQTIYGDARNDLINQRLVGEINLDGFDVSHTKDDIQWQGNQEEDVETKLASELNNLISTARTFRKGQDLGGGPSDGEVDAAVSVLEEELQSEEMINNVMFEDVPDEEMLQISLNSISGQVKKSQQPTINAKVGSYSVIVYLVHDLSPNDPYVVLDSAAETEVVIIVNMSHPHVKSQIHGEDGVLNYLRHCVYDGMAEAKARMKKQLSPETIKILKDGLLRVSFNIDQGAGSGDEDEGDATNSPSS